MFHLQTNRNFRKFFVNGNRLCVIHSHLNDMEIPGTKRFIPKGFELDARLSSSIWSIRSFITETLTALHMIIIRLLPFVVLKPLVFLFRRQCKTSEQTLARSPYQLMFFERTLRRGVTRNVMFTFKRIYTKDDRRFMTFLMCCP